VFLLLLFPELLTEPPVALLVPPVAELLDVAPDVLLLVLVFEVVLGVVVGVVGVGTQINAMPSTTS
jgi:hypothetical protein